jgi:hypothetical protein
VSSPDDTVDGPPPTPFQRARRRRRLLVGAGVVLALLVGAAVLWVVFDLDPTEEGLAAEEGVQEEDDPEGAEEAEETEETEAGEEGGFVPPDIELDLDEDGRPDTTVPDDEELTPPEVDRLQGVQRILAELLLDIDAAERAMLGFQLDVVDARTQNRSQEETHEVDDEIRVAALHALEALAVLRARMEEPVDDLSVEQVRDTYVVHLDSWVRWLETIADEPEALNDETGWFTIDINRTAAAFVRAVDEALDEDLDAEVVRFAQELVERGFPPPEDSQV